VELRERVLWAGEIEQNRIFLSETLGYVKAALADFVQRGSRKLRYFWSAAPYSGKRLCMLADHGLSRVLYRAGHRRPSRP
jgi:hypothetical protein